MRLGLSLPFGEASGDFVGRPVPVSRATRNSTRSFTGKVGLQEQGPLEALELRLQAGEVA